ncbi:hypothetical protein AYI68_g895 [Smittium mucronatum]|uniref:Reverse transcriptase domain-containing protein n=1 Tax=Smittium mucronatum TaxID=133383 RepID=A0A1R0H766_9FUNG|nr:hypothetical protein AYI68_g895 [Smittium mucronatum]
MILLGIAAVPLSGNHLQPPTKTTFQNTPNNSAPGFDGMPTVRIGNNVSKSTDYLRALKQGCPASPILFDFCINGLFKGIKGVYVSVLTSRIPGMFFVDDAVLFAESEADMQIELNQITDWLNTWEMTVN